MKLFSKFTTLLYAKPNSKNLFAYILYIIGFNYINKVSYMNYDFKV